MKTPPTQTLANKQSPDFKYIYSNAYVIQMTSNEAVIKFGINEDASRPNETILEQVAIVTNLVSIKMLVGILSETIKKFEDDNKITIPYSKDQADDILKKMVISANKPI
ncbi:hypothetical protein LGH82_10950 [Mesorhizobium sp. PAMC28654]|uniref:hypothetical protein n=1 Tax=Mesorhizobium sp. PAMC28654 TaxID=2880934 RepID=UPI001D0AC0AE|nr:hypothetical protein [Mesorhizobium sp. PAMC28654]UDL91701.1 hypothetical protein LGH82_10950 [Mesorhizobium sp. PAMC28654]